MIVRELKCLVLIRYPFPYIFQVRHSQLSNATPLSCWIMCENTGEVCCAHCNCMVGLGEVCTHVAAVLFYLETSARLRSKKTCTQEKCQWVIPTFQNNIPYDFDFTSAKGKKRKIDCALAGSTVLTSKNTRKCHTVTSPTDAALEKFYKHLVSVGVSLLFIDNSSLCK